MSANEIRKNLHYKIKSVIKSEKGYSGIKMRVVAPFCLAHTHPRDVLENIVSFNFSQPAFTLKHSGKIHLTNMHLILKKRRHYV